MIHERQKNNNKLDFIKIKFSKKDIVKRIIIKKHTHKSQTWRKYLQSIHLNPKHTSNIALYSECVNDSQNK